MYKDTWSESVNKTIKVKGWSYESDPHLRDLRAEIALLGYRSYSLLSESYAVSMLRGLRTFKENTVASLERMEELLEKMANIEETKELE